VGLGLGRMVGNMVGDADFVSVGLEDNEGYEVGSFVGELVVGDVVGGAGALVGAAVGEEH